MALYLRQRQGSERMVSWQGAGVVQRGVIRCHVNPAPHAHIDNRIHVSSTGLKRPQESALKGRKRRDRSCCLPSSVSCPPPLRAPCPRT